jgi:hypothetical protein
MMESPPNVRLMTYVFQYNYLLAVTRVGVKVRLRPDELTASSAALVTDVLVGEFVDAFKRFQGTISIPVEKCAMARSQVIPFSDDSQVGGVSPPPLRVEDSVDILWCPGASKIDKSAGKPYTVKLREAPTTSWTLCSLYTTYVKTVEAGPSLISARSFYNTLQLSNATQVNESGKKLSVSSAPDATRVKFFYLFVKNKTSADDSQPDQRK